MTAFDDVVDRLTERLRIDPELRLEVGQELRTHLEDSAAEFRQAGCGDEEAARQAVERLGDEAELANALWQANRRRLRSRAVARWIACRACLMR